MIAGWNTGVFVSYRREIFSAKTETKKTGSTFHS
jgi:hypothetical protein